RRLPPSTLFPYTTLFRSRRQQALVARWQLLKNVRHRRHHDAAATDRTDLLDRGVELVGGRHQVDRPPVPRALARDHRGDRWPLQDRKSTRLNSSHVKISY